MSSTHTIQSLIKELAAIEKQFAIYKQKAELLDKYEEQFNVKSLVDYADMSVGHYLNSYQRIEGLSIEDVYDAAGIDVKSKAFRDSVAYVTMRWSKRNRPDEDKEKYFLLEIPITYPHKAFPDMDVHERTRLARKMYEDVAKAYEHYHKEASDYIEYLNNPTY